MRRSNQLSYEATSRAHLNSQMTSSQRQWLHSSVDFIAQLAFFYYLKSYERSENIFGDVLGGGLARLSIPLTSALTKRIVHLAAV